MDNLGTTCSSGNYLLTFGILVVRLCPVVYACLFLSSLEMLKGLIIHSLPQ